METGLSEASEQLLRNACAPVNLHGCAHDRDQNVQSAIVPCAGADTGSVPVVEYISAGPRFRYAFDQVAIARNRRTARTHNFARESAVLQPIFDVRNHCRHFGEGQGLLCRIRPDVSGKRADSCERDVRKPGYHVSEILDGLR